MINLDEANHTNRELELMLAGKKPLAVFSDDISCLPNDEIIPEEIFSRYVESGQFIRKETVLPGPYSQKLGRKAAIKHVLFAVKDEEWRIHAMILLIEQHLKTYKWNVTCERFESALLGYTDEEIDAWCKKTFPTDAL